MRIFHTSDWHLGRSTCGVSRRPDHEKVLVEILDHCRDYRPHLILHSGDLFENSRPSVEDMRLAQDTLAQMAELAPTVVIAGNHDSSPLFDLFEALVGQARRLHFVGSVRRPDQGGILEFPGGRGETARLAMVPFVHANRVLDALELAPEARTMEYADRIQKIEQALGQALAQDYHPDRHILLFTAHLHVGDALVSRSERPLHVSETYATRASFIPEVSYAAFGHIHKPQALPHQAPGRYAGSPIQLDFGEEGEEKQVVLVEARPGRGATIKTRPLQSGRHLLTLKGKREDLAARADQVGDALVKVTIDTEEPTPGLSDWALETFPRATVVEVNERCHKTLLPLADELPTPETEFEDLGQAFRAYLDDNLPEDQSLETVLELFERARCDGVERRDETLDKLEALLA